MTLRMLGALLYLRLVSFQNWLRSRLRRLRQPKYFIGAAAFAAYFWFFFYRPITRPPRTGHGAASAEALQSAAALLPPLDWMAVSFAAGSLALLLFLVLMWVVPRQAASLGFSEAEIAFLFPAPVQRRTLVHFRLLSSQFRSLVGAAIMMLFSNRWTMLGGNALTHALGWWFIFSALNLHFSGTGFTLTRLSAHGIGTWRRRLWIAGLVGTIVGLTVAQLPGPERLPALDDTLSLRPIGDWLVTLANTAPLGWLLWPLKLVLGPFLAAGARDFLLALPGAVAVITLHYLWVVRTAVAFEDAAVEQAEKRAARLAAWRAGNRPVELTPTKGRAAPFRLAATGRPELAFLWKNLLSTWPYFTPRVFAACALVIAGACTWLNAQPAWRGLLPGISGAAVVFAAYTLLVGPQFARQDLRSDLIHLDLLKIYPLSGWQIVLGQLLAPAAILSGVLWLVLLTVAMTLPGRGLAWFTPEFRFVASGVAAVLVPPVVLLQLLVPNAAALLFPGWYQASRGRGGGMEVVGQRMIFFFAQLLTMLLALVPAVLLAALLIFILQWLIGPALAVAVAGVAVLAVLAGEVWCGVWWMGERFDRLDFSSDFRP